MAVQKSKVSKSRKGKRRSHHSLKKASLSTDQVTGERHLRHNMTADGFYKGKKIIEIDEIIKFFSENKVIITKLNYSLTELFH